MNRRSFFGGLAGLVVTAFVPSVMGKCGPKTRPASVGKGRPRLTAEQKTRVCEVMRRSLGGVYPYHAVYGPPRVVDGLIEKIERRY